MARIKFNQKQEEIFNTFIHNIPRSIVDLEQMIRSFTKQKNFKIAYDGKELSIVSEMFLSLLGTDQEQYLTSLFEVYIGEVWRHYFNGDWALCPEKKDKAFLKPVIYWGYENTPRFCPMEEIDFLVKERDKESLLESINHSKKMLEKHEKAREILFGDFKGQKK